MQGLGGGLVAEVACPERGGKQAIFLLIACLVLTIIVGVDESELYETYLC